MEQRCAKASGHAENCRVIFDQGWSICIQTSRGTRFSSPLGASTDSILLLPSPDSSPAECRRMCLPPPAPQPSGTLARTSAAEDDAQNLQGGRARRKQRRLRGADVARRTSGQRMSTAMPSQRAAAIHERKKCQGGRGRHFSRAYWMIPALEARPIFLIEMAITGSRYDGYPMSRTAFLMSRRFER